MDKASTEGFEEEGAKLNPSSLVIYLTIFAMGGCGLAYEYTLSKISSDILGNSIKQWVIVISVMMFCMGIGSDAQKYLKDKNLFDKFIAGELLLGLLGGAGPICMLLMHGSPYYVLVQYFFICSIGFLIGLEIPLLTRLNDAYTKQLKFNLGGILKMDYIGSLIGAIIWLFVLTKIFSIVETAFVLGLINVSVAVLVMFYFRKVLTWFKTLLIMSSLTLALLFFGLFQADGWTSYAEQSLYKDRIVYSETSPFQHIVLTEANNGVINCFINRHLQFSSFDEHIYHEVLVHPAMQLAKSRKNVLVLGGGDGLAIREILKYEDVESVTLVDLDPFMTELAKNHPVISQLNEGSLKSAKIRSFSSAAVSRGPIESLAVNNRRSIKREEQAVAQISVYNIDALNFVKDINGFYDVMILDFPDPNSHDLAKLYSREFYGALMKRLAPDGIVIQQSTSPIHAKEAFLCIGRTMESAGLNPLPIHQNVPSFGEWGWWMASRERNADVIKEGLASVKSLPQTRFLTPEYLPALAIFGKEDLVNVNDKVNTLTRPIVHELYEADANWLLN